MAKKTAVKPKRPISAFFFFTIENRKKLKEKNPNITIKEIAVQNSADWKKCTPEQKKQYDDMVAKDKERYDKQVKQLSELGYFINSEGVKSTDLDKKGNVKEFAEGTVMPKKAKSAYMYYFIEQ